MHYHPSGCILTCQSTTAAAPAEPPASSGCTASISAGTKELAARNFVILPCLALLPRLLSPSPSASCRAASAPALLPLRTPTEHGGLLVKPVEKLRLDAFAVWAGWCRTRCMFH
jgi:hypothetical protein